MKKNCLKHPKRYKREEEEEERFREEKSFKREKEFFFVVYCLFMSNFYNAKYSGRDRKTIENKSERFANRFDRQRIQLKNNKKLLPTFFWGSFFLLHSLTSEPQSFICFAYITKQKHLYRNITQ